VANVRQSASGASYIASRSAGI